MVSGDPSVGLMAIRRIKAVICDWCRGDSESNESSSIVITKQFRLACALSLTSLQGNQLTLNIPAKSVVVLELR